VNRWQYFAWSGAALSLIVACTWAWAANPPLSSGVSPAAVQQLLQRSDDGRALELAKIASRATRGPVVPQALLVQLVENERVIVVSAAQEEDDSPPEVGWDVPWRSVVEAVRKLPADRATASSRYAGLSLDHEIYPASRADGLYLLLNTAAEPAGFRTGPMLLVAMSVALGAIALRQAG
jgi:hypothetical protein